MVIGDKRLGAAFDSSVLIIGTWRLIWSQIQTQVRSARNDITLAMADPSSATATAAALQIDLCHLQKYSSTVSVQPWLVFSLCLCVGAEYIILEECSTWQKYVSFWLNIFVFDLVIQSCYSLRRDFVEIFFLHFLYLSAFSTLSLLREIFLLSTLSIFLSLYRVCLVSH